MLSPLAYHVLVTFVISLFPVALYCWVLGSINRRERPLLVRGAWDFIGVLFALSGMLLWTAPTLLMQFGRRSITDNLAAGAPRPLEELWYRWWLLWICYYALVVGGAGLLLILRSSVTAVYNVDVHQLPRILHQTLRYLGFEVAQGHAQQFMIAPPRPATDPAAAPSYHAAIEIDTVPSLCHATLRWYTDDRQLRAEVERELDKQLENARPSDNAAAVWFLGASTLLFGVIILAVGFFIVAGMLVRR